MPSQISSTSTAFTTLTAAGVTEVFTMSAGRNNKMFLITVANINTSVSVQYEKSTTTDFAVITGQGEIATYTENKNYELVVPPSNGIYVRLRFVTEAGGSAVTLNGSFREAVAD